MELTNLIKNTESMPLQHRLEAVNKQIAEIDAFSANEFDLVILMRATNAQFSLYKLRSHILQRMAFIKSHFSLN